MARTVPVQTAPLPPRPDAESLAPGPDLYDLFGAGEGFDPDGPAAQDAVIEGGDASCTAGRGAEFRRCVLRRCNFRGARWKNAAFVDVIFERCDFSNARLPGGLFRRVRFMGCKPVGADLAGAALRSVALRSLPELKRVTLTDCDLTGAELPGIVIKE